MKKVGIVAGTRPEVIKMAPLYLELRKSECICPVFISTAQHRQMLDQALSMFGIRPDYDMDIMRPKQTLSELTARILLAWETFFNTENIDAILVQGDTTTVLASSIAAFYHNVRIGHVEAGLRTFNMHSPFPEEMNRRLVSPIADWSFAPTELSLANLVAEGIPSSKCYITGNTVVDALLYMISKLDSDGRSLGNVAAACGISDNFYKKFMEENGRWILVTGHRRESFGTGFENICKAIFQIVEKHRDCGILYPVHLNPNVREPVCRLLGNNSNVELINPVSYEDFICLMKNCRFVLSDSGGVQEEAPSLGKPVLVMRDTTERPEGISAGTCRLVGTSVEKIVAESNLLLSDDAEYSARSALKNPYGDGTASVKIRKILEETL